MRASRVAVHQLSEGSIVAGRYRVVRPLSAGAMGAVYVVEHITTKKLRALKLMQPEIVGDATLRARFVQEAQIGARIESEHVVEVIDAGVDDAIASPFIAMELLQGETLSALVARSAPLAPGLVRDVFEQLCHAIAAAHDRGVVHRDLKPDNVFLASARRVGVPFTVKVLDFGIAKLVTEARTRATAPIGTPLYMAPEQMVPGGAIGAQSDVWALGLIAFHLLTGKPYWRSASDAGASAAMLINEVQNLPLESATDRAARLGLAASLPAGFDAWFARAVDRDVDDRWSNARAAWNALESVLRDAPAAAYTAPKAASGGAPIDPGATAAAAPDDESTGAFLARRNKEIAASPRGVRARTSVNVEAPTELAVAPPVAPSARARRSWPVPFVAGAAALAAIAATIGLYFGLRPAPTVAPTSSASPNDVGRVSALACAPAKLEGDAITEELAAAVGVSACARAAIAIDVAWLEPSGTPLVVTGSLTKEKSSLDLKIGDRAFHGDGRTPLDAIAAALPAITASVSPPPLDRAGIDAWGAADEAGARRVHRAWRSFVLNTVPDHERVARDLVSTDPGSPWTWLLTASAQSRGTATRKAAIERGLELVSKQTGPRALVLKGAFTHLGTGTNPKDALALARQAYQEAPEDAAIAAICGTIALSVGASDEGRAIAERAFARAPTETVNLVIWAIRPEEEHDLARDARYLDQLVRLYPEARGWPISILHHTYVGEVDAAKASIAFAERLGLGSDAADAQAMGWTRAYVELVAQRPKEARDIAAKLLGDPRGVTSTDARRLLISAYFLEGRVVDGETAEVQEIDRQRATVSPFQGTFNVVDLLRVHRWLGRPTDPKLLDWLDEALQKFPDYTREAAALVRTELALARALAAGASGKARAKEALESIERMAEEQSGGDRALRDAILVSTVPLVRVVRGERDAATRWTETTRAPFRRRRLAALDGGLALDAIGDGPAALDAYRLAQDPILLEEEGFATLAAKIRELHLETSNESPRVLKLLADLERLMKDADPGIRDAIEKL